MEGRRWAGGWNACGARTGQMKEKRPINEGKEAYK